jgi:predicted peptidase
MSKHWILCSLLVSAAVCHLETVSLAAGPVSAFAQRPVIGPNVDTRSLELPGESPIYYSIWVPDDYRPARPVPLVLALHFGGNPEGAGRALLEILVAQALPELGAVIVAPDSKGGGWSVAANEQAVNLLLEDVLKTYNIDRRKIAVTGFSMGGAGAWHFGMKYPERFSAVIPVSGRPPAALDSWRLPVLAIHSLDDEVVPIGPAQKAVAELRKNGVRAELIELKGIPHHQTFRFVDGLRRAVPWLKELWK